MWQMEDQSVENKIGHCPMEVCVYVNRQLKLSDNMMRNLNKYIVYLRLLLQPNVRSSLVYRERYLH